MAIQIVRPTERRAELSMSLARENMSECVKEKDTGWESGEAEGTFTKELSKECAQ